MPKTERPTGRFRVADWEVDPSANRVYRRTDKIRLEPKVMAVLVHLANRPGQTVTRRELEAAVWTGTVVGYDAVAGTIQKLRRVFQDDTTQPRFIETLSKKGYRLIAPVTFPESASSHQAELPGDDESAELQMRSPGVWIAAAAVSLLAAVGLWIWLDAQEPPRGTGIDATQPKSIAVLPFRNLTADPAQDYFADGMSDDLISSLAEFSDLQVIARDSTFFYKDKPLEPGELAKRLNARYLLRGSVRREGDRIRITARLIDAESGKALWADSFDDTTDRLFQLQDRITHRIVTALAGRMNVQDRQELGRPATENIEAYDYFLFGRQRFFLFTGADENQQARESFLRAIALDPDFALAYAMLAWTHAFDAMNGWSPSRRESLEHALKLAGEAIDRDEAMPVAYFVRGLAFRELGDRVHALVEAEKAIAFDPNYAGAHVLLATLLYFNGKPQEGLELMNKAVALNPNHPYNYSFHLGQAHYILKHYPEAIDALTRVLDSNPAAERAHLWLAAAYAQAGRLDDAEWEMEQVLATNPELSLSRVRRSYPFTNPADFEHLAEGLRTARLTE